MSHRLKLAAAAAFALFSTSASAATAVLKGPPPRAITDPKSVVSTANPDAAPLPVAELYDQRGGGGAVWSPDGRTIVFSTNLTGRYNLWKVASAGGFPQQLTQSDDRQTGMSVSPDGKTVLYESDYGGGAISDLFATPLAGGAVVNLTSTPDVSENAARFSPDGTHIVFDRRPATSSMIDLAWMDLATRKVTMLTHETVPGSFWIVAGFAEGGRVLIASRIDASQTQSVVWRIDTVDGKAQALTDTGPKAYNEASAVSADGRTIALKTQTPDGTMQAALFDTATRKTALVKPDGWEQGSGSLSPDGATMIFSSDVDGRTDLFTANGGHVARLDLPPGSNEEAGGPRSLSPDGKRLLVAHEASNTPFDLWTVDLAANRATQLTTLGLAAVSPANLPPAQIVHYKSEDGTVISALVWVPFNLKRDGSAPAVVYVHGGPAGQSPDYFSRLADALASRGYVVIAPNPRGSTGYGHAFEEANHKDLGGGDLTDEIYGAKFLSGDRLCRRQEDRHDRRLLWRLHDIDGARQDARSVGGGRRDVRHHRLVLDVRARGAAATAVRDQPAGRSGEGQGGVRRREPDDLYRQRQGAAARAPGRERHHRAQGAGGQGGGDAEGERPHGRRALLRRRGPRLLQAREPDRLARAAGRVVRQVSEGGKVRGGAPCFEAHLRRAPQHDATAKVGTSP